MPDTDDFRQDLDAARAFLRDECRVPMTFDPGVFAISFGSSILSPIPVPGQAITACRVSADLLTQLGPFLAILHPLMCAMQTVTGVYNFATGVKEAVTDAVTGNFNTFDTLVDELDKLQDAASCVVNFLPQLALPQLLVGVLQLVLVHLVCIRENLRTLYDASKDLQDLEEAAATMSPEEAAKAAAMKACQQENIDLIGVAAVAGLAAVRGLLEVLNVLGNLIGVEIVPAEVLNSMDDFGAGGFGAMINAINDIIELLIGVVDALPDVIIGAIPNLPDLAWARDPNPPVED